LTVKGGISLTSGKKTTSDNYVTYHSGAVYTHFFSLGNYIPAGGSLVITLPSEISIKSDPFGAYQSSSADLVSSGVYTSKTITLKANAKIPAGDYTVTYGGLLNRRSFSPSGIFGIKSFTSSGKEVGAGSIDNIVMNEAAKFSGFTVAPSNSTNGARSNYLVSFTS